MMGQISSVTVTAVMPQTKYVRLTAQDILGM